VAGNLKHAAATLMACAGLAAMAASAWAQTAAPAQSSRARPARPAPATVPEVALSPEQLAIADLVHAGSLPCDDGSRVEITADEKAPGYFMLQLGRRKHRIFPVESRTGAIRLEDARADLVWIQLSNKSMLMSQKLGRRLADDCRSERQAEVANAMRANPPPSLLEPLTEAVASEQNPKD